MDKLNCVICMEPLRDPNHEVYETICGHKFHKECLMGYCYNKHDEKYATFSSINCPLCNTSLNCRFDGGHDIFPEKNVDDKNNTIQNITKSNVEKALDIIPEDEYDLIDDINDIMIDNIDLSNDEKEEIVKEIKKRKSATKGGKIKSRKRQQTKTRKHQKPKTRKHRKTKTQKHKKYRKFKKY